MILPILIMGSEVTYMGKDVSSILGGFVGFYPMSAVEEIFKVFAFAWSLCFLLHYVSLKSKPQKFVRSYCLLPVGVFFLYSLATWIQYPAMFADHFPQWLNLAIYRIASTLNPSMLMYCAGLIFAVQLFRFVKIKAGTIGIFGLLVICAGFILLNAPRDIDFTSKKPNVILVGIDSMRADRVGTGVVKNIDQIKADESAYHFENHIVGIPRTFPSWAEILSGQYAAQIGIRHMFPSFWDRRHQDKGLATAFGEAGYQTLLVSDFAGDIFPRFNNGFEKVLTPTFTLSYLIRQRVGQVFPLVMPFMLTSPGSLLFPTIVGDSKFGNPKSLVQNFVKNISPEKPFFGTLFFSTAHFPYAAPYPYYKKYTDPKYTGDILFAKDPNIKISKEGVNESEIGQVRGLYDGALVSIDDALGDLVAYLKNHDLYDNTIIAITADHGESLYEDGLTHGHGEHLLGEEVLKVPLIMKLPKGEKKSETDLMKMSRSIDVATTMLGAAGIDGQVGEGIDLFGPVASEYAYAETGIWFSSGGSGWFQQKRISYPGISGLLSFDHGRSGEVVLSPEYENLIETAKHRAIITPKYKFVYIPTAAGVQFRLFDRELDPANRSDISGDNPRIVSKLKQRLYSIMLRHHENKQILDDYLVPL